MKPSIPALAVIALLLNSTAAMAETIYVRTLTGNTITIDIALDQTIAEFKLAIQEEDGVPPEMQRLVFVGNQLEDEPTLSDYNMQDESTVYLILRTP